MVRDRGDDMQCVSGDVQDMTTAVNDIDSGLQMASSLSSTVFAVSPVAAATLSVPRYSLAASAAGNGVSGNAGMCSLRHLTSAGLVGRFVLGHHFLSHQ